MPEGNPTVADYYLQQYIMTHQMRYQQMLKMAQMEAQQSYEARVYQQKYLQTQAKQLQTYVGTLEKDLTAYLDDKAGGTTDADRDLKLMRFQIDIAKAKASQQASAKQRKIQIEKAADAEFDIPRTQVQAIQTSGANIEKRGRLATTDTAALAIVKSELADIVVDNAGSGSAVNAAQNFMSSTQQAFDRAGQPGHFTNNTDEIKKAVEAHFSTEIYTPQAKRKPDSNLDLDIPDAKKAQKAQQIKKYGGASTGGLSTAMKKVETLRTGGATKEEVGAEITAAVASMTNHDDYLTLVTELNKDGSIDEEDWHLFEDRITTDGRGEYAPSEAHPVNKPYILKSYERMVSQGYVDQVDLPRAQELLFDPTYMGKRSAIGESRKELETLRTKASTPPRPPSYEAVRQRGRELYDPIRMKGSPHAGQQYTVIGSDGAPITINVADIDAMQDEFEGFLNSNPLVKQDFGLIQEAYGLAGNIKVPGKDIERTSPQYIGYTLHQQWKAGTVSSAEEVYKIASQVAGDDDQLRNNIVKNFHAYNIQPTFNQYKGVDMKPASRRLADEFLTAFDKPAEEAKTGEELGVKVTVPIRKMVDELVDPSQPDGETVSVERTVYVEPPENYLELWSFDEKTGTYNPEIPPTKEAATGTLEVEVTAKEKPKEVVVEKRPVPLNTNLAPYKSYNYQVFTYDAAGNPEFIYVDKAGKPTTAIKMKPGMITEAQGFYDKKLKELEGK